MGSRVKDKPITGVKANVVMVITYCTNCTLAKAVMLVLTRSPISAYLQL